MRRHRNIARLQAMIVVAIGIALHVAAEAEGVEFVRELGKIKPKELDEISGLAASRRDPEVLWLHNDGDSRLVFAASTSGDLLARVRLPVRVDDSEDIAI